MVRSEHHSRFPRTLADSVTHYLCYSRHSHKIQSRVQNFGSTCCLILTGERCHPLSMFKFSAKLFNFNLKDNLVLNLDELVANQSGDLSILLTLPFA